MKRNFLGKVFAIATIAAPVVAQNMGIRKPMNIIYILADDLGYGDVGCYGQEKIKTPNIDVMAREGMLFTQHYAGCTVSAPSRASLMTGLHTGHTQIRGNYEIEPEGQQPMLPGTQTLGTVMKNAGYVTGIFGKWGLGHPESESVPGTMGFDEFYGYNCQRQAHSYYPEYLWHNTEKVYLEKNKNKGREVYSQDLIHEQAKTFIATHHDRPFFAMLTYTLPHAELNLPHDSIYNLYKDAFGELPYDGKRGYTPSERPYASFAAMVARLDKYVGEILDLVRYLKIEDRTLVIFTSDNGPHREGGANPDFFKSYGPLRGVKRDLYEGGIRVPMIAWAPGSISPESRTDLLSAFWDMMPTFIELSGKDPLRETVYSDGISIVPTLFNQGIGQKKHDYLYWEFHEMNGRKAIRQEDWKLILQPINGETKAELYHLKEDLHEDINLAEHYPNKVKEMMRKMEEVRTPSEIFNFGIKH